MSSYENLLDIDLNDVVSKAISEKIAALEERIESMTLTISSQSHQITKLKEAATVADIANGMIESLRAKYAAIKLVPKSSSANEVTVWEGRYRVLRDAMQLFYGKVLNESLLGFREDFNSIVWNCRGHKEEVCNLLRILDDGPTSKSLIDAIMRFRTPSQFSKEEIVEFIKAPHYGYNGTRFGNVQNWIGERFSRNYAPYDLLFANDHIVSEDCFALLLKSIADKVQYSEDFFGLPQYNTKVTDDQIKALGTLAAQMSVKGNQNDTQHGKFIRQFISKFRKEDIDMLFEKMALTNTEWAAMNYGIFPLEYQMVAFRRMQFKALSELVQGHGNRFSAEQKEAIYADWFHFNPYPHTPRNASV